MHTECTKAATENDRSMTLCKYIRFAVSGFCISPLLSKCNTTGSSLVVSIDGFQALWYTANVLSAEYTDVCLRS